jgi:hypothetical protein
MKLKSIMLFLLVVAFVVAVAGCSSDNNGNGVQQVKTSTEPQTSTQQPATPASIPVATSTPTPTPSQSPTPEATPIQTSTHVESSTQDASKTTLQFSESKQNELIKYTKQYGAEDVEVAFAEGKNGNGFVSVSYIVDTIPKASTLQYNIATVLILSRQLAKESGIPNPDVNVIAMLEDGTGLGIGTYYSSTGKTDIDVSDCHL